MTDSSSAFYTNLSENIRKTAVNSGFLGCHNRNIEEFLKDNIDKHIDFDDINKHVLSLQSKLPPSQKIPRNKKKLTATDKRRLKLFIPQDCEKKYALFLPLHNMWHDYMESLYSVKRLNQENKKQLGMSLLKADYHGSILSVLKSKCPSYVGVSGIMIKETKNTFTLITEEDKMKVIPKQNSIFGFNFNGFLFTIHGNHFRIKSSERTSRKFKSKPTIDL